MNRCNKRDTIGWQGELLVMDILKRDALNGVVHNSQEDADDPLIGISLHGNDLRIPLPDFAVTNRGGTLFTSNIASKSYFIETKTKLILVFTKILTWLRPDSIIAIWNFITDWLKNAAN